MTASKSRQTNGNPRGLRVAGYVRVSSTRQLAEGDSLEAQQNGIRAEVDRRSSLHEFGVEQLDFYVDAGRSAKNLKRPKWQRLQQDISDGKIDAVVCYKLDRLTRSILDFAEVWAFFEKHGVQLITLRENFDTSTAMGKAMLHITLVFAQLERELTGERTRATMEDRASKGLWNGGYVYGYSVNDEGKLEVDPGWAKIVKQHIFDAFEELGSTGAVARRLRELGIQRPARTARTGRTYGNKPFDARQVAQILQNRVYLGEIRWGEAVCQHAHEAIVDEQQFNRVQRKFNENKQTRTNHRERTDYPYILKGLVRCGKCGATMSPYHSNGRNGRYFYYACTRRMHNDKGVCDAPYMPAEQLDQAVVQRCIELSADEQARDRIIRATMEKANEAGQKLDGEIEAVRHRLSQVKTEIDNLLQVLKQVGSEGLASVKDELDGLEQEQARLKEELNRLQSQRTEVSGVGEAGQRFLENWRNVAELFDHATGEEQRALIRLYVEAVEIEATDAKGRAGNYRLTLFPEAVTDRSATPERWASQEPAEAADSGPSRDGHGGDSEEGRQSPDEPAQRAGVLRDGAVVPWEVQKAPRAERFSNGEWSVTHCAAGG